MSWELLAIFAALCFGSDSLIKKEVLKTEESVGFAWIFNTVSAILFLLIFVRDINFPSSYFGWLVVLFSGLLYVLFSLVGFKAYKHTDISIRDPLAKTSVFFTLIFSVLILNEQLTANKIIGVLLLFAGVIILTWHGKPLKGLYHKGIQFALLTAFIGGVTAIVDKIALSYFSPSSYGFLAFLVPSIYLTPFVAKNSNNVKKSFSKMKIAMISSSLLSVVGYFAYLTAFTLTDVSNVVIVVQVSILVSVFGGYLFHKEKDLGKRLLGALFVIAGTVLVIRPFF